MRVPGNGLAGFSRGWPRRPCPDISPMETFPRPRLSQEVKRRQEFSLFSGAPKASSRGRGRRCLNSPPSDRNLGPSGEEDKLEGPRPAEGVPGRGPCLTNGIPWAGLALPKVPGHLVASGTPSSGHARRRWRRSGTSAWRIREVIGPGHQSREMTIALEPPLSQEKKSDDLSRNKMGKGSRAREKVPPKRWHLIEKTLESERTTLKAAHRSLRDDGDKTSPTPLGNTTPLSEERRQARLLS